MFYENLEKLCEQRGMAVSALIRRLDISPSRAVEWRRGSEPRESTKKKIADYFGISVEELCADDYDADKYVIPVYGSIACGVPIEAVQNIIGKEELPAAWRREGEFIALRADGDSMSPAILSGDIVIIKKSPDIVEGKILAIEIGNDATLKKVCWRGTVLTLIPLNPAFSVIDIRTEEIGKVRVIGVAVEVRRTL